MTLFDENSLTLPRIAEAVRIVLTNSDEWKGRLDVAVAEAAVNEFVACLAEQIDSHLLDKVDEFGRLSVGAAFAGIQHEGLILSDEERAHAVAAREDARLYLIAMLSATDLLHRRVLAILDVSDEIVSWWNQDRGAIQDAAPLIMRLRDATRAVPNLKGSSGAKVDRTAYEDAVNLLVTRAMRVALRRIPETQMDAARQALDALVEGMLSPRFER